MMAKVYKEELAGNLWKCTVCQKEHKSKTLIRDHVEVVFSDFTLSLTFFYPRRSISKVSTTPVTTVGKFTRQEIHSRSMLLYTKGTPSFMVGERTILREAAKENL